jgi:hypothetical protein
MDVQGRPADRCGSVLWGPLGVGGPGRVGVGSGVQQVLTLAMAM